MYTAHFGLREPPFGITPDTSFFFAHASYLEALNTLLVAARSGEGFIKVVGEVGTGKTLLCRKFLNALDGREFTTAYIPNPYLEPMTLLLAVADELRIKYPSGVHQHQLLRHITLFLLDSYAEGKRVLLCLDEAQALPVETLEALRLLTNFETERRKLLQVVLFGQPELDVRLDEPRVRQLKQRITFASRLEPLSRAEFTLYLRHRLAVAEYGGARLFSVPAERRLYRASRGIPRLANILAHKAMMAAFGEGAARIADRHVKAAVADTESAQPVRTWPARLLRYVGGVAPVVALLWAGSRALGALG
jgi:MSHA biogenesis protein MshM